MKTPPLTLVLVLSAVTFVETLVSLSRSRFRRAESEDSCRLFRKERATADRLRHGRRPIHAVLHGQHYLLLLGELGRERFRIVRQSHGGGR